MAEPDGAEIVLAWSGGKDAAMALHELRRSGVHVDELFTTIDTSRQRSSMHGLRRDLLARQADALDLPIRFVELPTNPSNESYEGHLSDALGACRMAGVDAIAYADVHLEDVRAYRERLLEAEGLEGRWPLWGRGTRRHAEAVIEAGFEATIVALDAERLAPGHAGRSYDRTFLDDLPTGVDPAGEDGAFHTFVRDGPPFQRPVPVRHGETVTRSVGDGTFRYVDLLPDD